MSKYNDEKMLEEMINDNFIEISEEGQESINGGKAIGTAVALYSVRPRVPRIPKQPKTPKLPIYKALYSISPKEIM